MIKTSQAIRELLEKNRFLAFGLSHKLLNLTQTAAWIKPLIAARVKREVSSTTILMALSRMLRGRAKTIPKLEGMKVTTINVYSHLCELTFDKSSDIQKSMDKVYFEVHSRGHYMTISQGVNEITIILSQDCLDIIERHLKPKAKFLKKNLSALGVQFHPKYVDYPGMMYFLIQHLTLQNINIWEISSTYTELIFYLDQKDVRLAFDTLSETFLN